MVGRLPFFAAFGAADAFTGFGVFAVFFVPAFFGAREAVFALFVVPAAFPSPPSSTA
jgi:hypothetical protein